MIPAATFAIAVLACNDFDRVLGLSGEQAPASQSASARPEERRAVELSRTIPGLAGFFYDTSGNVVVAVKSGAAAVTRAHLQPLFRDELTRSRRRHPNADILVRGAQYTFVDLRDWRDRLESGGVLSLPSVLWLDLDEVANRVVVGVEPSADVASIRAFARQRGVPAEAFDLQQDAPYVPQTTLQDQFRPVQGGTQIQRVVGTSRATCTLGFAALWNSQQVFITAGHCSPNLMGTDSVAQFQPIAPLTHADSATTTAIGREILRYSVACGSNRCASSDAAIYGPVAAQNWTLGRMARPTVGCMPGPCSPVVLTVSGYWVIDTTRASFVVNDLVSKIGAATGWSQGSVSRTCVDVSPTHGVTYRCQMFANYGANDGDSGSPILLDIQGGNDSTVTLGGIHSGKSGNNAVFSPWSGIVADYGALSVAAPQNPTVPPTAPDSVPAWVYAPENLASDTGASYDYYADVIIVSFNTTATQAQRQAAIDSIHGIVVGGQPAPPGEGFYYVRLEAGRRLEPLTTAVTKLWSLPQVGSASLVTRLEEQFRRPKDQGDFALWDPRPDSAAGQNWGLEDVAAPLAWGCETGRDAAPPVGFVDNGFHSVGDLTPNVSTSGAAHAQYGSQSTYHGTQVASVAGAQGDNQSRMTGMAWDADLRLYQAPLLSPQTMDGIRILAQEGARVINISLAVPWTTTPTNRWKDSLQVLGVASQLRTKLQNLSNQGISVLIVQGAGNGVGDSVVIDAFWQAFGASVDHDSLRRGGTRFRESILVVAASDRRQGTVRKLAAFSDTGATVDVAAPGVNVGTLDRFNNVVLASGTSLSAPLVTGLGALLLAFDSTLTPADLRQFILTGAQRGHRVAIDPLGGARTYPIINAYESLKRVAERPLAPLCGNRVWVAGTQLVAQRDTGAAPQTLVDIGDTAAFVNVHHGGRRIDVLTNAFDFLSFVYNQGTWTQSANPPPSPDGGTWNSLSSLSHDGDTAVTVLTTAGNDTTTLDVRRGPTGGSSTHVANIVVPLPSSGSFTCIFIDTHAGGMCMDSAFTGTSQSVYARTAAYSPLGDKVIIGVSTASTQTTSVGGMTNCPWDSGPDPQQCISHIDYSLGTIGTKYHQIDLQTGRDTVLATPSDLPVIVFWAAVAEDGGQLVSGEGVVSTSYTLLPDTNFVGFHQRLNSSATTGCTLRYRQDSTGVASRFATASAHVCQGFGGDGSIAPAPPITSRSQ